MGGMVYQPSKQQGRKFSSIETINLVRYEGSISVLGNEVALPANEEKTAARSTGVRSNGKEIHIGNPIPYISSILLVIEMPPEDLTFEEAEKIFIGHSLSRIRCCLW
jgi:hypothetical protein